MIPPRAFLRKCRSCGRREKLADSTGASLSGYKLLIGTLVMRRLLRKHVFAAGEQNIGILLPPSVGASVVNTAVAVDGRVAVNLNYTMSDEVNNYCIRQAGIKHVLTSKRFLEKNPVTLDAEMVLLEDLREKVGLFDKLAAAFLALCVPMFLLERWLGLTSKSPDDLFTIIFTSGSTGDPKGVMLTYGNVMSNILAVDAVFHISQDDVLLGVLPFFHSFGFTGTFWLVLCLEPKGVYHFNPLDARTIGKLCEQHGVTITMATPTFLRTYLKRCTPEQFSKLDTVITGAEKLPPDLAVEFEKKFGVFPTEGYGTTELSPVASVNVPPHRAGSIERAAAKPGTIGRPLNGVSFRITDPDSGAVLGVGEQGILWIKGPNVMRGYLNQPEKTAEVIRDGWYNTGDMAMVDEEGFITITGRLSRFSKIGGEMVPHIKIENAIAEILEENGSASAEESDNASPLVAVSAVTDDKKGERIVVLHLPLSVPVDEIIRRLGESGLPNLWLPGRDSFYEVANIPLLGTGKLDLKGVKQLASGCAAGIPEKL